MTTPPAFPSGSKFVDASGDSPAVHVGMDTRTYLAAMIIQGLLAATPHASDFPEPDKTAMLAVNYADALMAELAKGKS